MSRIATTEELTRVLDDRLRRLKDVLLAPVARVVGEAVHPNTISIVACVIGLAAAVAASRTLSGVAVGLWLANRVLDGFDGTLARATGTQSDFGGYLDIVLDFTVYAAIPFGIAWGSRELTVALVACALVGTFLINAASLMYLAAILERRGAGAAARGELTTVTMPDGLVTGTETVVLFTLSLLFPRYAMHLFVLMGLAVLATCAQRLVWARRHL